MELPFSSGIETERLGRIESLDASATTAERGERSRVQSRCSVRCSPFVFSGPDPGQESRFNEEHLYPADSSVKCLLSCFGHSMSTNHFTRQTIILCAF